MLVSEQRMAALEARTALLEQRLDVVDAWTGLGELAPLSAAATSVPAPCAVAPPAAATSVPAPRAVAPAAAATSVPAPCAVAPPAPASRAAADAGRQPAAAAKLRRGSVAAAAPRLEDLLGGRVLGWLGGVTVLVGLLFFLVIAASRGWIGEEGRVLMATGASLLLLAGGAWLHERRGRAEAALAAAATGIAGLFAATVVAGPVYDLVPAFAALSAALLIGALATALALRWHAPGIGWLGILGALLSPALVGAAGDGAGIALMLVAYAAAAAVMLWQRWHALAGVAFLVALPQLASWLVDGYVEHPAAGVVAALSVFGVTTATAAIGFEWRAGTPRLSVWAHVLLGLDALALAGLGAAALGDAGTDAWLAALALAHLAAALLARRSRRVSRELPLALAGFGIVLADVAFASVAGGLPLVLGWVAGAVGFSTLARAARHRSDESVALAGLGGHLLLAAGTALTGAAPLSAVAGGASDQAAALAALVALTAGAWAAARLVAARLPRWRLALDAVALACLGLLSAVALDGAALTAALAAEAVALVSVARRTRAASDRSAVARARAGEPTAAAAGGADPLPFPAALAFLGAALAHALIVLAPPAALAYGADLFPAALGLGSIAGACVLVARSARSNEERTGLLAAAAVLGLYLASVALVTPFQPGVAAAGLPLSELDVRQQGQVLLSSLWAIAGVAALVAGLLRDARVLRLGALALLGVTAGKVFLIDLSSLTSLYRVGSCIAFGLLLLVGAFAWQRIRPRPLPDLRDVPGALR